MSFWNQFSFPDPVTEMAGRLFMYHDLVLVVVVMVLVLVGWFLGIFLMGGYFFDGSLNRSVTKNEWLETAWTVIPSFFLGALGYVSLDNLYDMEVGENVDHIVKVTGHQWYWEYRYEVNFSKVLKDEHKESLENWLKMSSLSSLDGEKECVSKNSVSIKKVLDWMEKRAHESFENVNELVYSAVDLNMEGDMEGDNVSPKESEPVCLEECLYMALNEEKVEHPLEFLEIWIDCKSSLLSSIAELFMKGDWFLKYESYSTPESELFNGRLSLSSGFRNQDVSAPCCLAHSKKNEVLVSTSDVMHSWGVSELGVKADAVPGRMNALSVEPVSSGVSFGNCYELCGEGHSEMPILVLISDYNSIIWFLKSGIMLTEPVEEFFGSI